MMSSTSSSTEKEALRQSLREKLAAQPTTDAREAAEAIHRQVLALPEVREASGLLVCLSFGHEVDTWALVDQLLSNATQRIGGQQIYVPRAERRGHRLAVHPYPCPLETLSFGLQQPPRNTPALPSDAIDQHIDVALILGLGFDHRGIRLGYGAGFFDRFLAGRPFPAIGLAYALQVVETLPADAHDIPMSVVVTEEEVIRPA